MMLDLAKIDKMDLERYHDLKAMVDSQEAAEYEASLAENKKRQSEQRWKCHHCSDGVLRLKIFEMRDGARYYRKCDQCSHRTKAKKMDGDIEGA